MFFHRSLVIASAFDWNAMVAHTAWPLVALLVSGLLVWKGIPQHLLDAMRGTVRSVKLPFVEVAFSERNAPEVRQGIEEVFGQYRATLRRQFDALCHQYRVRDCQRRLVDRHVLTSQHLAPDARKSLRCTIYVQDPLLEDRLYQLVDYYPKGEGRGRTLSLRFGIIGAAWRSGEHKDEGDVPTDQRRLIERWGMTTEEAARAGQGRRSFVAVVVHDKLRSESAVVYIDADVADAFGADQAQRSGFIEDVTEGVTAEGLDEILGKITGEMRRNGPAIRLQ